MKRQRPGLPPLAIRLQVAARQAPTFFFDPAESKQQQLDRCLKFLFGDAVVHLDHEPALRRRAYNPRIKNVAARYTPHAHDPDCLLYRPFAAELDGSHHIKTQVRGDHGQFPDRVLIKRERKRESKAIKKTITIKGRVYWRSHREIEREKERQSRPIQSRSSWPAKGSRPFQNRRL